MARKKRGGNLPTALWLEQPFQEKTPTVVLSCLQSLEAKPGATGAGGWGPPPTCCGSPILSHYTLCSRASSSPRSWTWLCSVLLLGTQLLSFHLLCQLLLTASHRFQMATSAPVTPSFQSAGNDSPLYLQDCGKKQLKAGPGSVPHPCPGVSDTLHRRL